MELSDNSGGIGDRKYVDNPVIPRMYLDRVADLRPETVRHHLNRYGLAASYTKRGDVVIDLCCGTGYGSEIIQKVEAGRVIGVELSEEAINYAREHSPSCEFIKENVIEFLTDKSKTDKLPQPDTVVFFESIEHFAKPDVFKMLDGVRDLLKPSGQFFLSTPRDIRSDRNLDHISQWNFEELRGVLSVRFKQVDLFGQDWASGNFVRENPENASFYVARCSEPIQEPN